MLLMVIGQQSKTGQLPRLNVRMVLGSQFALAPMVILFFLFYSRTMEFGKFRLRECIVICVCFCRMSTPTYSGASRLLLLLLQEAKCKNTPKEEEETIACRKCSRQ